MRPKCHTEIDNKLIGHLRKLSLEQIKAALEELRKSKKFVRGIKGNQLAIPTIIQTEDMSTQFVLMALVDSGCTGSRALTLMWFDNLKCPPKNSRFLLQCTMPMGP